MSEFVWCVNKSGYVWRRVRDVFPDAQDRASNVLTAEVGQEACEYHPLREYPTLFRDFADLGDDRDSRISFANKYGHLTAGVAVSDERGRHTDSQYANRIRWPRGEERPYDWGIATEIETDDRWSSHIATLSWTIREWERAKGKREGIGETKVGRMILANLRHRVSPSFEATGALSFVPTDLLSALWLQFAQTVGGGHVHRRCQYCRAWFQLAVPKVEGRRGRGDKRYCDTRCRMKAAYERKVRPQSKGGRRTTARRQ